MTDTPTTASANITPNVDAGTYDRIVRDARARLTAVETEIDTRTRDIATHRAAIKRLNTERARLRRVVNATKTPAPTTHDR